jgi:hypothetical protein
MLGTAWLIWIGDKLLAVGGRLISILGAVRRRRAHVRITYPEPGSDLTTFDRISAQGSIPRNTHFHLFVVDPARRVHPQRSIMTTNNGTWVVYLDKNPLKAWGNYDLVAALADGEADQAIQQYFSQVGPATKWQGLGGLPDGCKIEDIVTVGRIAHAGSLL